MADISKQQLRKEIAAILKDADLADTSAKNVRLELEEKLDCKLISRKKEIDELVMEYVNKSTDKKDKKDSEDEEEEDEDEEKESEEDEESEEEKKPAKRASATKKPPVKRAKKDSEDESDASDASGDGSEDEYVPVKKAAPKPRGRKPAQKKKKGSDSDGDEDWVQEKAAPRKSGGGGGGGTGKGKGYTRPLTLSPELAALVGQEVMARHEVIKKMWAIIKERNLYDPKNKQFAICDDAMQKVIGVKRFRMFGMMKYLKDHFIA